MFQNKKQLQYLWIFKPELNDIAKRIAEDHTKWMNETHTKAVSYTHLTLPTTSPV